MKNNIYITDEQLNKLKNELEYYIHTKRPEVVKSLKEAKSFGDLSENSEYDAAREEQAFVEAKIKELETLILNAEIIEDNIESDVVVLGSVVKFENETLKATNEYKIVGVGADPLDEKVPSISTSTPIAQGLLGSKVGDLIDVQVPSGVMKLKVLDIK